MRVNDLFVAGAATHLPGRLTTAQALASGLCDARTAERTGVVSVSVSDGESGPEMAVRAARTALERAGAHGQGIDLILHADVYYQGHDLWAPASYVQREAVGNRCPAVEVRQLSNGGMAALQLAAGVLAGAGGGAGALLTTGDRFCAPGFDRWNSDPGTVYGDAGTALVLSTRGGFARVRSLATVSEPELEGIHRGGDPFGPVPFSVRQPMDLEVLKREFIGRVGISYGVARVSAGQSEALKGALADADAELADIRWFVLPQLGLRRLTSAYLKPWGLDAAATTWEWARTVGHLGAGDQFSGLESLVARRRTEPGDLCLLAGVGAGYTWTCGVLEMLDTPEWER